MTKRIMIYGGVRLAFDPKELRVVLRRRRDTKYLLSGQRAAGDLCEDAEIISGVGEVFGSMCDYSLARLREYWLDGKPHVLSAARFGVFYAVLTELSAEAGSGADVIKVTFRFSAEPQRINGSIDQAPYHIAESGETLWTIARDHNTDVNILIGLNPQIRYILDVPKGERVLLRPLEEMYSRSGEKEDF